MGNQFKNVAVIGCLKTFLFIFNIVFWLCGLCLLVVGVWAEVDLYRYLELSPEFSGTAPHVLIGVAGLIVLISSVAFSCILSGQPVLLYIYGGLLGCIFMMMAGIGASVLCYRGTFPKSLHDGLTQNLLSPTSAKSNFDFPQSKFQCCGVSNYTDWVRLSPQRMVPLSCCANTDYCITANYSELYQRGCYDVIVEYLQTNMGLLISISIGTAIFPLIGTLLSCSLATYVKKSKYDVMN